MIVFQLSIQGTNKLTLINSIYFVFTLDATPNTMLTKKL